MMKSNKGKIPFEIIDDSDYIWRTPKQIISVKDTHDSCPKCQSKLRNGFALLPVGQNKKAKVPGLECLKCSCLFITHSKPVIRLLIDNLAAKDISLDGEYYWNYTRKKIREKRKEKKQKRYRDKMEKLHGVSSGLALITVESDNSVIDYIICQNKNDVIQAPSNPDAKAVETIHYSNPIALELLTKLCRKGLTGSRTINGKEYYIRGVYPEEFLKAFPESILPQSVQIKTGGGYAQYIKNGNYEIIDLLMYSPFTKRYEIAHATLNKTTKECYFDIGIYRSFVNEFGNPGISIWAPTRTHSGYSLSFEDLSDESLIHAYGYNVSKTDGLTDIERQTLLSELVDLNLMSVSRIVYHLDFLIRTHSKDYMAQSKWEYDKKFIMNYKVNPERFMILHG